MGDPSFEELARRTAENNATGEPARARAGELDRILGTGPDEPLRKGKPSKRLRPNAVPRQPGHVDPVEDDQERVSRARPQASRIASRDDREIAFGTTSLTATAQTRDISLPTIDDHAVKPATVSFTCVGSSAFTASWPGAMPSITLRPFEAPPALRLKFDPRKPGRVQAAVVFTYRWDDGHQEQARVLLSAQVEVGAGVDGLSPKPQAVRLKDHTDHVELGEHVIGGRDVSDVALPAMMDLASGKALVIFRVEGSPAITASWPGANHRGTHLDPMSEAKPLKVQFAPRTAGDHRAKIELSYSWPDGHSEVVQLSVHGRARRLEQLTDANNPSAEPTSEDEQARPIRESQPSSFDNEHNLAINKLAIAVGGLHSAQREGVRVVAEEEKKYKPPYQERSIWLALAETALIMGTAGVASAASKLIAPMLGGVGNRLLGARQEIKLVRHGQQLAYEKVLRERGKVAIEGLATSIEDGMKHAVDLNRGALSGVDEGTGDAHGPKNDPSISSDATIAFFSRQRTVLDMASEESQKQVRDVGEDMRPLLQFSPRMTIGLIRAIAEQTASGRTNAERIQQRETMAKYLTYRARAALGTERVESKRGPQEVTKLDAARRTDGKFSQPDRAVGLIDIIVNGEASTVDEVRVIAARVRGLPIAHCKRLAAMDLGSERVPLRIVFHAGMELAWITRDEFGRIRSEGRWLRKETKDLVSEAERHPVAKRLVTRVLAKSLDRWGVPLATDSNE